MSRFLRLSILVTGLLFTMACWLTECGGPAPTPTPSPGSNSVIAETLTLRVQAQPNTYTAANAVINYSFTVSNNGTTALTPVSITDDKMTVTCPALNTVGNFNDTLDPGESIICTGSYTTTQADVTNGSVTNNSRATAGGLTTAPVTTRIEVPLNRVLTLSIAANPTSYCQAGQIITYNYTITNTGSATLGPAQFIVRDDRFPNSINCGQATTTLATNQTVTCSSTYTTSQTDATVNQITNTASAQGAGAGSIQNATVTVNRTTSCSGNNPSYTPGSTIKHDVVKGEWLLQISRCYGADFDAVQRANPQIPDPHWIFEDRDIVTVPNIGSNGTIYGPPCVVLYTVVSGDTWQSIANAHNADLEVLMEANRNVSLTVGQQIKVPRNSRQSGSPAPVPPTPTTPPVRDPIRLNFPAGTTTVRQSGTIGTPDTIRYVFTGATGQILSVRLTVPTNDVGLAIFGPNNTTLKSLDNTTSWSGTLTANGDHFINLVSTLGTTNKQYELEVTLNTPAPASPVEKVLDINPTGDSNVSHLGVYNGQLYFQANRGDGVGAELWRYDRGLNAISMVRDINPGSGGSEPSYLMQFGEFLYFRANGNDQFGVELWRLNSNGDAGRVTDINKDAADGNPMYLTVFNNALYFSARGTDNTGVELWRYDGGQATRITDINPGPNDTSPAYLAVFNNVLYFSATSPDGGTELWKYDGTTAARVADINPNAGNSNPAFLTVFNNMLYFSANGGDNAGTELWRYDGTNPPTRAADINPGVGDSVPTYLTVFNNALYFSATGDASGFELWKFDGTTPTRVTDINPAGNANPAYLTVFNNELYFQANANDGSGAELWRFKGP